MLKEVRTMVHPDTNEVIIESDITDVIVLDAHRVAYRNDEGRYCVACFNKQIIDVFTQSSMSCATGVEYIECYACKTKMKYKASVE